MDPTDRIIKLEKAVRWLLAYVDHNCLYDKVDTPDGDFCTCGVNKAVRFANDTLEGK